MKNYKKINIFCTLLFLVVLAVMGVMTVNAETPLGSAKLSVTGDSSVFMGKNYTATIRISDIVGEGINGVSARYNFNFEYFELVSATNAGNTFSFSANKNTGKFNGISMDGSYISSAENILTLVLKPKKTGTTQITITDCSLSDQSSRVPACNVTPLSVEIIQPSTDANLKALGVTGQTLSPAFNPNTTTYTVNIPNSVSSVVITATQPDGGSVTGGGTKTGLKVGTNTYTITSTAQDGTTKKSYTINIIREAAPVVASSNNNLSALSVDGYTMSPAFNANTNTYSVSVPYDATSVKVNATKADSKATGPIINGTDNLQVGNNTVTVEVTAENGTKKTYTINVIRQEKPSEPVILDSDSTLKGLTVSGGSLSPAFSSGNSTYTLEVGDSVSSIDVNAIPNSDKSRVEVTGNTSLKTGFNAVEVTVTAEDGSKSKYIINVYRKEKQSSTVVQTPKKSNNNYLTTLTVNGASLSPKFNKDVVSYNVTVPYEVSKLDISYLIEDKKATAEILENDPLKVGEVQQIYVKVTAEDGSVRMYTINATRSALSSNAYLKELSAKGFNLNESFDKTRLNYSMNVDANTKSLNLTALAENDKAKVEILGNSNLKVGSNILMVSVTDENGFSKIYQLDVIKPEATIFGLSRGMFFTLLAFLLGLLGLLLFILFILNRRKKEEPASEPAPAPTIDFKPEFNFGSKNGTDDDVVYPGGILNQGNGKMDNLPGSEPKKLVGTVSDADYTDSTNAPFDFYDDTITKDELIAAIREGMDTKNSDKLKMLLKQEELNKLKKDLKNREGR